MIDVAKECFQKGMSQKDAREVLKKQFKSTNEGTIKATVSKAYTEGSPQKKQSAKKKTTSLGEMNAAEKEEML